MPTVAADALEGFATRVLAAAGAPQDLAQAVAAHLVEANLKGVDSHGVLRLAPYLEEIADGGIDVTARPRISREAPAHALVDGGGGFGITALDFAAGVAADKAAACGVAAVGLVRCGHTGRVGHYAERIAARGQFALITGGGGYRRWPMVAPFGGARRALGTNPYAFALPGGKHGLVVVDFATSATSQGKLAVRRETGEAVPEGWILDKHGRPSTTAEDFYQGGMILPAGGHKGYGMALIAELLGAAMLGSPDEFNWLTVAIDLAAINPEADYGTQAERIIEWVKDTPPADGFDQVMVPGEPEARLMAERRRDGIPLPDAVWTKISAAAATVGIDAGAALAG